MNTKTAERASPPSVPLAADNKRRIESMLRVDHAGEYAAIQIYAGQLAVFRDLPHKHAFRAKLEEMETEEHRHLAAFNALLTERAVRPSLLSPLWGAAGFALGAATALLGERAAMACTAAVEEVIGAHYLGQERQLAAMDGEEPLREKIAEFRADELEHRAIALEAEAEKTPAYRALTGVIQSGCRVAIRIAERI